MQRQELLYISHVHLDLVSLRKIQASWQGNIPLNVLQ